MGSPIRKAQAVAATITHHGVDLRTGYRSEPIEKVHRIEASMDFFYTLSALFIKASRYLGEAHLKILDIQLSLGLQIQLSDDTYRNVVSERTSSACTAGRTCTAGNTRRAICDGIPFLDSLARL
jgi:hypothetical protein